MAARQQSRKIGKKDIGLPQIDGLEPTKHYAEKIKGSLDTITETTTSGRGRAVARIRLSLVERLYRRGKLDKAQVSAAEAYHRDWVLAGFTGAETCQQWKEYIQRFGAGQNVQDVRQMAKERYFHAAKMFPRGQRDRLFKTAEYGICLELVDAEAMIGGLYGYSGRNEVAGVVATAMATTCDVLVKAYGL